MTEEAPHSLDAYRYGISQDESERMDQIADQAFESTIEILSPRQKEVFRRRMNPFKEIQSEATIARELGISRRTVRTHLERGMVKYRRADSVVNLF